MRISGSFLTKLLLLALVFWSVCSEAQVQSFKHFGLDRNIFPSRIECVNQSSSGELIIGTLAGLVFYDGYNYVQMNERTGLAENAVSAIGIWNDLIWVGHWAGSLTIMSENHQMVAVYDIRKSLDYSMILRILPVNGTGALIVTKDGGLYFFNQGNVERIVLPLKERGERIVQLRMFEKRLFAISDHAIYETQNLNQFADWTLVFTCPFGQVNDALRVDDHVWMFGTTNGVKCRDITSGNVVDQHLENETSRMRIVNITSDFEEYMWLGSAEQGIVKYHPFSREMVFLKRDNGLSFNQIRTQFLDREGTMWIGTSAGLDQYLGSAFTLFEKRFGMPDNLVWDFTTHGKGLLLATASGLYEVEINFEQNRIERSIKINLGDAEPRQLLVDPKSNETWVVDAQGGLWNGHEDVYKQQSNINVMVNCVADVNGEIWLGTESGVFILRNGILSEQFTAETGLGGNNVNGIYYSEVRNETWITSLGGQVTLLHDGRFQKFGVEQGITSTLIQDAAFDEAGSPWFATYDDGVMYLAGDTFINLSSKVDLTSTTTFSITIDGDGSVWIGHNWGIDHYRIAYGDLEFYGSNQGFIGIEVNPGAMQFDNDANLWMGTLMGLLKFNPKRTRINIVEPRTFIRNINIGGRDIIEGESFGSLDFSNTDMKIDFSGVSLAIPDRNVFKYRLLGMEETWKLKNNNDPITYQSLPPGNYTFEIISCNNSGTCNSEPARFSFKIRPPFYSTWWFYTFVFLLIVFLIYVMDSFRITSVIEEKNRLTEQIALRDEQILDLSQSFDELQVTSKQNTLISEALTAEASDFKWMGEVLIKPAIYPIKGNELTFEISDNSTHIAGILDTGLTSLASVIALERVKNIACGILHRNAHPDPMDIVNAFCEGTEQLQQLMEKHRGFAWTIWFKIGENKYVHARKMSLFIVDKNHVMEWKTEKEGKASKDKIVKVNSGMRLIAVSDGISDLLNADGLKTYSINKLRVLIEESIDLNDDGIVEVIKNDLEHWSGSLEHQRDINIITISHA